MVIPKMSQLRKGVAVKIVLKADQRTGKLTTGNVSEIFTRGDHPRGIKVRLTDGRVGRVQSLAPSTELAGRAVVAGSGGDVQPESSNSGAGRGLQKDHRLEGAPHKSLSLFDYIRVEPSTARAPTTTSGTAASVLTTQEQLESEFPKLDTALISAILVDYPETAKARTVLSSLS